MISSSACPIVPSANRRLVVIGDDAELSRSVGEHAGQWGNAVRRLLRPDDEALRRQLREPVDGVAVVSRDDIVALRYCLLVEHLAPGVELVVTIFDRTVAAEITRSVPNCTVVGMTDAIVPTLLGTCVSPDLAGLQRVDDELLAVKRTTDGVRVRGHQRWPVSWRNRLGRVFGQFRPVEPSSRALLTGLVGLLAVAAIDTALGALVLHEPLPDAAWHAVRTLTTVGSSPHADHAPAWYKAASAISMLAVLAWAALFTAGLVDRLTSRRLTSIVGARAVPRHDHVIVVGLGQVGLRLCSELQALGIGVVAVERDRHAPCLPLARELGVPVVLGRGGDRFLLRRLSLPTARALAAVSSDSLENIAVSVAARAVAGQQRIVLRAGGDEVTAESKSLFRIGAVCDLTRIAGPFVAAHLVGLAPVGVLPAHGRTYALFKDHLVVDLAQWRRRPDAGIDMPAKTNGNDPHSAGPFPADRFTSAEGKPVSHHPPEAENAHRPEGEEAVPAPRDPDGDDAGAEPEPHVVRGYD